MVFSSVRSRCSGVMDSIHWMSVTSTPLAPFRRFLLSGALFRFRWRLSMRGFMISQDSNAIILPYGRTGNRFFFLARSANRAA